MYCAISFANRPRFGRRYTQAVFFGLGGLCLLVAPVLKAVVGYTLSPTAAKGLAIAGKLTAAGVFNGKQPNPSAVSVLLV